MNPASFEKCRKWAKASLRQANAQGVCSGYHSQSVGFLSGQAAEAARDMDDAIENWEQISGVLDAALAGLSARDRDAVRHGPVI